MNFQSIDFQYVINPENIKQNKTKFRKQSFSNIIVSQYITIIHY